MRYAEEHNDAYPTFREFSTMIQNQARKKNHPNVSAGSPVTSSGAQNRRREDNKRRHLPQSGDEVKQALKTKVYPDSGNVPEKGPPVPPREKHCLFHKKAGHELTECKAFNKREGEGAVGYGGKTLFSLFLASSRSQHVQGEREM